MNPLLAILSLVALAYAASAVRCWSEVRRYRMPRTVRPYRKLLRGMPAQARFQLQDRLASRAEKILQHSEAPRSAAQPSPA